MIEIGSKIRFKGQDKHVPKYIYENLIGRNGCTSSYEQCSVEFQVNEGIVMDHLDRDSGEVLLMVQFLDVRGRLPIIAFWEDDLEFVEGPPSEIKVDKEAEEINDEELDGIINKFFI